MGILRLYVNGTIDTYSLPCITDVVRKYNNWWCSNVRTDIVDNLRCLLQVKDDENETIKEIMEFRDGLRLVIGDVITVPDIIRFKSITIYGWLYLQFAKKMRMYLNVNQVNLIINIIDHTVLVAIDAICNVPEISNSKIRYNSYIYNVIDSLARKLDGHLVGTYHLKMKFFACILIQRQWRKSISDPKYYLCRKRLNREFDDLIDRV
jgi:hypothetical protein